MNIYEPYPSKFGLKRGEEFKNIDIIEKLNKGYNRLVATDILENVPNPVEKFSNMVKSVNLGGHLVMASFFQPVIKCYLTQTFHLLYTFNQFTKIFWLQVIGILDGSHATIFKKIKEVKLSWNSIRFFEKKSKITFLVLEILKPIIRMIVR